MPPPGVAPTRDAALELDRRDPLAPLRDRFRLPAGVLYFDGNSLGPVSAGLPSRLAEVIEREWGEDLVGAWNRHHWIDLPTRVAAKIAPLVGAAPDEIAVGDSTSVNLFKLLAVARALRPGRRVVLSEREQFPTDLYMAQGLAALTGDLELRVVAGEDVEAAIDDDVAVVYLSHVRFKTGELLDMDRLTRAAHRRGALVLWDLSHSAGALELALDEHEVDLAVGCGYKFLNGGPGAPSFLYVARRHQQAASPLPGWMGHRDPFAFALDYHPAQGVERFLCGTPPILSLAALDAALDAFDGVELAAVRRKSVALGELFRERLGGRLDLVSPADPRRRGSQISLRHPHAGALVQALQARGVVADHRDPDVARFGLAPLYLRYADVWDAVEILAGVLATQAWDRPEYHRRPRVT